MAGPVTWRARGTKQGLQGAPAQDWDEDRCVYGGRTGKNYLILVTNYLVRPRVGTAEEGWLCHAMWH